MSHPLDGWVPIQLRGDAAGPLLDWCYLGDLRPTDPFFDHTIERAFEDPFRLLFRHRTGMDALEQLSVQRPGPEPAGLIFHMSRCGSTLLAQMFASLPWCRVLSEASVVAAVLRAPTPEDLRVRRLRDLVGALGYPGTGETRLVLKLEAAQLLWLPLWRRAFPSTPWVFLHRDPVEVLVSNLRTPGAAVTLADTDPAAPPEEALARLLGALCAVARDHLAQGGMLMDYRHLPEVALDQVARHFGLAPTPEERAGMLRRAGGDGKRPEVAFRPDSEAKQATASAAVRAAVARWVRPAYRALLAAPAGAPGPATGPEA